MDCQWSKWKWEISNIEHLTINVLHTWWGLFSTQHFFFFFLQRIPLLFKSKSPLGSDIDSKRRLSRRPSRVSRTDSSQRRSSYHRGNRPPSTVTPLESHPTSSLGALQGPGLAVIIVSMTMHAQCISASSDKQWSFTKTRRSLRQLVKSMLRVSRLIKPSSLSSDTVSIVLRRLSTARWLEWNAHQSESWAGLMIPCAAY